MEWKNIYRGLIMGASDVIPGVSGGTIAVLLGIYDRLIAGINGILSRRWKQQLGFLIPLAIGMAIAVLALSRVIEWLFEHYPQPTQFFFMGLILGILPYLFRQADARTAFKPIHFVLLLAGGLVCGSLAFLNPGEGMAFSTIGVQQYVLLFLAGIVASAAMILPGISGSFMLLVMGVYQTVISAISDLKLDIIAVVGFGIVIGILFMSKLISYFMDHYRTATFAIVIGLVIGSLFVVYPGFPGSTDLILASVITFAIGLLTAYILGKVEYKD